MATNKAISFQERKAQLRQSFLAQLPQRLQSIREHLAGLSLTQSHDQETLKALHLLFHTLKGSGASFGFSRMSALAQEAEQALIHELEGDRTATGSLLATLERALNALEQLGTEPDSRVHHQESSSFAMADPPDGGEHRRQKRIYLCDDDPVQVHYLSAQLACFGYQVTPFTTLAALREAVGKEAPAAVIMDVMFPEGRFAGPEFLTELNAGSGQTLPSVFISSRDDFASRLQAVKAGGSAYCVKPLKTNEVVEFLDLLTRPGAPDPFNILVVDDDPDVASYHTMVLEEAGMMARMATQPAQVLEILEHFNADLVLMDMYMPDCSGPELAQVLRQIPGHVSLPIIYVSSETDVDRQFKALEVGADGFLTKPIDPRRLIAEVNLRAERMRTLRSLMVRDSLTGLLNHNTITHYLEISISLARRRNHPLCFAMIDVDRFKRVNDQYGHPAGDQVLVALSRGLRLSLRDSDLVGRYGGEEFAVVLAGVGIDQAQTMMDTLRQNFASILFAAGGEQFTCTFSAGIAAFPDFATADTLIEAADVALYRAKHAGRNRIEIASVVEVAEGIREASHGR
ncbi:MAG TPA: diguanylate cyclase [Gammaproteobacteria bacterium]|nr:diguanylate cyclase [Gammaproteobacteria bacterium]